MNKMGLYIDNQRDYNLIVSSLSCYQIVLKQAITENNQAVAEQAKRPYRPLDPKTKSRILPVEAMNMIEKELSDSALLLCLITDKESP
jgi:hypothetical protein